MATDLYIRIGPVTFTPVEVRKCPEAVVQRAILETGVTPELAIIPAFSSRIEDFISATLEANPQTDQGAIVNLFFQSLIPSTLDEDSHMIQVKSEAVEWNDFEVKHFPKAVNELITKVGQVFRQPTGLNDIQIKLEEANAETSIRNNKTVSLSKVQIVRRALDVYAASNKTIPIEKIIHALTINTMGHEVGHIIDEMFSMQAANSIPLEWGPNSLATGEITHERFAESWGRFLIGNDEEAIQIIKLDNAIQLAKVNRLWNALANANQQKVTKLDLGAIFRSIKVCLAPNSYAEQLLKARKHYYYTFSPENYALPYSMGQIEQCAQATGNPLTSATISTSQS